MTLLYLLDTDVISVLAGSCPNPDFEQRVLEQQSSCALAAPTIEERTYGIARLPPSRKRHMLEKWLAGVCNGFTLLPFDVASAQWLGLERARLGALGTPAPRTDGEIAAIATTHRLTLVTRNLSDFTFFPGLRLDNWFTA